MLGMKITNFHYTETTFAQPGFVEYPKWVRMSGYPDVIANSAEEEANLLARPMQPGDVVVPLQGAQAEAIAQPVVEPPTKILTGANDEREILLQIAKEKNIKVDARWKTDRIRATIEKAGP